MQVSREVEGQKNQYGHADANRVKAPVLAMRPNGEATDERNNYHYRENE